MSGDASISIVSWNLNGIDNCHKKGGLAALMNRWSQKHHQLPDIICVQETKLTHAAYKNRKTSGWWCFVEEKGYDQFHSFCGGDESRSRMGVWGAATFVKRKCRESRAGWDEPKMLESSSIGRVVITHHGNFVVFNLYVPCFNSAGCKNDTRFDEFIKAEQIMTKVRSYQLEGLHVLLVGDLNVFRAIDEDAYGKDGSLLHWYDLSARTIDKSARSWWLEGYLLCDCCGLGLCDVFRELNPTKRVGSVRGFDTENEAQSFTFDVRIDFILSSFAPPPGVLRQHKKHTRVITMGAGHGNEAAHLSLDEGSELGDRAAGGDRGELVEMGYSERGEKGQQSENKKRSDKRKPKGIDVVAIDVEAVYVREGRKPTKGVDIVDVDELQHHKNANTVVTTASSTSSSSSATANANVRQLQLHKLHDDEEDNFDRIAKLINKIKNENGLSNANEGKGKGVWFCDIWEHLSPFQQHSFSDHAPVVAFIPIPAEVSSLYCLRFALLSTLLSAVLSTFLDLLSTRLFSLSRLCSLHVLLLSTPLLFSTQSL